MASSKFGTAAWHNLALRDLLSSSEQSITQHFYCCVVLHFTLFSHQGQTALSGLPRGKSIESKARSQNKFDIFMIKGKSGTPFFTKYRIKRRKTNRLLCS
jgi:hypothetical protein